MVSSGVVALVLAALAQAVYSAPSCGCGCAPVYTLPAFEEGCCPGPVVEKKTVVPRAYTVPFSYSEPTFSRQCFTRPAGVDRKVIPSGYETPAVCETQETVVKVPTTDVQVQEQPLCRKTCTTSEYVIQIPIVETTCTSAPLCKKTVRTQDNVLTTVAKKTACAKQVCTQNQVVEQPYTQTVCQNYQGSVTKAGAQTVLKPEVVKSCVQLPPRPCLKPATGPGTFVDYGNGAVAYPGDVYGGAYGGAYAGDFGVYGAGAYGAGLYGAGAYGAGLYGAAPYAAGSYYDGAYGAGLYGAAPYAAGSFYDGAYGAGLYGAPFVGDAIAYSAPAYVAGPGPVCSCAY